MQKKLAVLLAGLALPALAQAAHELSAEERLMRLEAQQAELYHTLSEKKEAGLHSPITDRLHLSGLLEVEGFWADETPEGLSEKTGDLTLATAQLGIGAQINDRLTADLTLLFEEGEDEDFTVDEAFVTFENGPWSLQAGRLYLPFGVFHTSLVSDPLTLGLGETRETALVGGWGNDLISVSGFVFNGESREAGRDDQIRDFGAALNLMPAEGMELGVSFLSDLADTDAGLLEGVDNEFEDAVGAWSAYAIVRQGPVELSAEVLSALRRFKAAELGVDDDGKGDKPLAWNLELAWTLRENWLLAARLEGSDELFAPELQYGAAVSWGLLENSALALEYLHGEFDDAVAPDAERDQLTVQLAVEF